MSEWQPIRERLVTVHFVQFKLDYEFADGTIIIGCMSRACRVSLYQTLQYALF